MAGSSEQAGAQAVGAGASWGAVGGFFAQADAQLVGINGQQTDLQAAIGDGKLWMDENVAKQAVDRCKQAITEITESLNSADRLIETRKFGDNEDGRRAAKRFAQAGQEYVEMMKNARTVIENMAATYLAAGRAAVEADEAGKQSLPGGSA